MMPRLQPCGAPTSGGWRLPAGHRWRRDGLFSGSARAFRDPTMKLQPHVKRVLTHTDALAVFGLSLFTDKHPHVLKVLRDEDYWKEFDEISMGKWGHGEMGTF